MHARFVVPVALLLVLGGMTFVALGRSQPPAVQAGDLVFHRSHSRQSRVIAEVTGSPLTHVGVVLPHGGELAVLEASGPVSWTPLDEFVDRGEGGQVEVRRFADTLSVEDVAALVREGERLLGTPYDARFEWGPRRIYCSELVFLVVERALDVQLVVPQRFGELTLTPAARRLAQRRLGRLPRPNERVVTPAALAASELLWTPRGE
ncbi:MAG: YiiX/YebB-like N1pC/P60 family cysteine hydrolase [Polyangiales bacterium]|nr:hypothetical protein [Sandaracinaceae bacterium]